MTKAKGAGERRLEYTPLSALRPHPKNSKLHDPKALDESLGRFGYTNAILIDDRTGLIAAGHGRWELLLAKTRDFAERPEGIDVDEHGEWLVPTIRGWSSKDDEEAEAYLISDNRIPELGGWDKPELAATLTPISTSPQGLKGLGFTPREVKGLLEPDKATTGLENSYGERADNYRNKQVRSIIFEYPVADFDFVIATAAKAAATYKADSPAELFVALLHKFEEEHPA